MKEVSNRRETTYVAIGFLASLLHWSVCFVFFALLLYFLKQKVVGCIKGLLIITTRGILSSAVGVSLSGILGLEKWALIFIFSIYILNSQELEKNDPQQFRIINSVQILVWLFAFYSMISSLFTGSYPVTSIFKIISFVVPFTAILYGVSITKKDVNWAQYCYVLLTPLILASVVTIPLPRFKIVNESFQGVINHPNLYGVFGAIYVCFLLYSNFSTRGKGVLDWKRLIFLLLALVTIYLSESRTGMFSTITVLVVYYLTMNSDSKIKFTLGLVIAGVLVAAYFVANPDAYSEFTTSLTEFIYKRDTDDILESRLGQIDASNLKYNSHKLLGSGFGVPYVPDVQDFSLSMDLRYEAGNLFISLLGDTGIIGLVLFLIYMLYILFNTKPKKFILFVAPIIISFGEMAFFATNNIAIYYYVMLATCVCIDEEDVKIETKHNSAGIQRRRIPQKMRG